MIFDCPFQWFLYSHSEMYWQHMVLYSNSKRCYIGKWSYPVSVVHRFLKSFSSFRIICKGWWLAQFIQISFFLLWIDSLDRCLNIFTKMYPFNLAPVFCFVLLIERARRYNNIGSDKIYWKELVMNWRKLVNHC